MKFSCERCGKRYATADLPIPGRIYKLKCKACGHLIVVKGSAAAALAAAEKSAAPTPTPTPMPMPMPTAAPFSSPPPMPGQRGLGEGQAEPQPEFILQPLAEPVVPTAAPAPQPASAPDGALRAPGETGYVDLFADGGLTGLSLSSPLPSREATPAEAPRATSTEAVPDVARADPFAFRRAELAARAETPTPDRSPPLPAPRMPEFTRPRKQKNRAPVVLVGLGLAAIGVVVTLALWRSDPAPRDAAASSTPAPSRAAAPAPAPARTSPAPAARPSAPAPAEPGEPVQPEDAATAENGVTAPQAPPARPPPALAKSESRPAPRPAAKPKAPARAEPARPPRVAERDRRTEKQDRRDVAKAEQPRAAAPPAPPEPDRASQDADADLPTGLAPEEVQKVIAASRKAFDTCLRNPSRGLDQTLGARQITLHFTVQSGGSVAYPTIDDVATSSAPVGQCLKKSAAGLAFPAFRGEPVQVDLPIAIPAK